MKIEKRWRSWVREIKPWDEAVEGARLLDALAQRMGRHVALPRFGAEALALWVAHTYGFELRSVTAYLGIESPEKRCGKTTLLSVLNELACRPIAAANISSPAFFRVIEEARPTLLIDEADAFLQGNEELKGILNSGYTRNTAFVVRVGNERGSGGSWEMPEAPRELKGLLAGGNGPQLARFSCWCPKVMAAIGHLPETLADRCIVLKMHRKPAREKLERVRPEEPEWEELRRKCARFVADHADSIARATPSIPEGLNDRAADIWEPLLAVADLAGTEWGERARSAAVHLTQAAEESSPVGTLLLDIFVEFVKSEGKRVFSRDLVASLRETEKRPWGALRRGKEIDEVWLARQLAPYGIRPKTLRIGGQIGKGYAETDFEPLYGRYIPRAEIEAFKAAMGVDEKA